MTLTIPLVLRSNLTRPLSVEEGDANLTALRDAAFANDLALASLLAKLPVNVTDAAYGAKGDAVLDCWSGIQAAINFAISTRRPLAIPPNDPGAYYKVTAPLVFNGAVSIICGGARSTTIFGVGMSAGQHVLDFNCVAGDVIEQVSIEDLTIRSSDGAPNGLRIKNVANVLVKGVRLYNLRDGITIDGIRCYTHTFEQLNSTQISGDVVTWAAGFVGGGQFVFSGCSFYGNRGGYLPSTAFIDNLSFVGCNWEQCTGNSFVSNGTLAAISVVGSRTEGCDGVDFVLAPTLSTEYVGGINFSGNVLSASDAGAAARIRLGGGAGSVRGFCVVGNVVTHGTDSFVGALVQLFSGSATGLVSGNYLRGTTCVAVDTPTAGVICLANENLAGRLPEYSGVSLITQGTFTATATGMTTSPTGTAKYSVNNGAVTLDLPNISGTSNATTFTLTGAPAAIRPVADKDIICRVQDNGGAITVGLLRVKTTGVLEIYSSAAGNAFTVAGAKSINSMSLSYTLQ